MKRAAQQQAFLKKIGSVAQLLPLFNLLPDVSFFIKDRKGRFVALNHRGCEYCGVKSEREALGKTDRDFFPLARAAEYILDDLTTMKTGRPILNRVEPAPESEGSSRLVLTNKIPLRNAAGRVIGVAGFSRQVEHSRSAPSTVRKLANALDYMHRDPAGEISTVELAAHAGLSVRQFERVFRKSFNTSPHHYLLRMRIETACRLLTETADGIAAIAQQCGFYDNAHFTRSFKSLIGLSPLQYRRDHQQPGSSR
jgi:AraC-like DNA-binding protein